MKQAALFFGISVAAYAQAIMPAGVPTNAPGVTQPFDRKDVIKHYIHSTFYPAPLAIEVANASLGFGWAKATDRNGQFQSWERMLQWDMTMRVVRHSIFTGAEIAFKEDNRFTMPYDGKAEFSRALLNVVSMQKSDGHRRIAWSRMVTMAATVAIESEWHPRMTRESGIGARIGDSVSGEFIGSFYNEFAKARVECLKKKLKAKYLGR